MTKEKMVHWEVSVRFSDAALARLMKALIMVGGTLETSSTQGHTATFIIKFSPSQKQVFADTAKPWEIIYRSPTFFDHGSIRPFFKNPEDEITGMALVLGKGATVKSPD